MVGVSISGMGGDEGLVVPTECVAWCRGQDVGVSVCDDMAPVDLDWWNTRLARHAVPARIVGRDTDGAPTDDGVGYLRRADLTSGLDADRLGGREIPDVGMLYRVAAWLAGHPDRDRRCRVPDNPHLRASRPRVRRRYDGLGGVPTHPLAGDPRRCTAAAMVGLATHSRRRPRGGVAVSVGHRSARVVGVGDRWHAHLDRCTFGGGAAAARSAGGLLAGSSGVGG